MYLGSTSYLCLNLILTDFALKSFAAIVSGIISMSRPPSLMLPPSPSIFFCSGRMSITACVHFGSISELFAFLSPQTFLANSMTAIWKPKHRPR